MISVLGNAYKKLRFKSIQSSMAFAFLCLITFTIFVLIIVSYSLALDSLGENSREYIHQLIGQVNRNIEAYVTNMENISLVAQYNNDVRDYLSKEQFASEEERGDYENRITQLFKSVLDTRKDISSIMVFGYNGRYVVVNNKGITELNPFADPKEQEWYKKAVMADGKPVVSSSHVQNILNDDYYRWVVSLSREISSGSVSLKKDLGVFLVDLNYSIINDMLSEIKLGQRGYMFIIDSEGNIVYHPQQQLIYSNVKSEMIDEVLNTEESHFVTDEGSNSRIYNIMKSQKTGWKIVGVAYVDELVTNRKEINDSYFFWGLFCLIISIIISLILSRRISMPIKTLESHMNKVENGNFDIKVDIQSSNEIGQLSRAFNIMIEKIKELIGQNIKEQELKRKSELKALQAQINPHFLYNTLDSIIWMAESKKSEEVVKMTSALARLFRISISKGEEIITISNEVEHITNYLTIQKMRYRDKLDFKVEVDGDILNYKTLKIILQPLVENAIYHGIKNKIGVGIIQIHGRRVDNKILLQVIDNGVGMSPDKIRQIFEESYKPSRGSGIGVRNVNERIKLYFGNQYGIDFESEPDAGTTANIWLPVLE
ncbi:MAG: cache domain-containing sensor histidine kinase [Acetivibrionales bacterium]